MPPEPRANPFLAGHEAAVSSLHHAAISGRLHHGWLLTGPEGVGKATFAYRAARRLLGATDDPEWGLLGASPEDRVSRMEQKIDDYIRFGVPYVWVIDPETSSGHIYTAGRRIPVEDGIFRATDPDVEIDINAL